MRQHSLLDAARSAANAGVAPAAPPVWASTARGVTAVTTARVPATTAPAGSNPLKRKRLIDQHDRDAVADRIAQTAGVTDQLGGFPSMLEFAFALRTDQNLEQSFVRT